MQDISAITGLTCEIAPKELALTVLHGTFLALAIQTRLHHYVAYVIERDPIQPRCIKGRLFLDYALRATRVTPTDLPCHHERDVIDIDKELVRTLLSHGSDPNQPIWIYDGQTPRNLFYHSSQFHATR
jgi:hypothetical protein